jgi:hypothetical protein
MKTFTFIASLLPAILVAEATPVQFADLTFEQACEVARQKDKFVLVYVMKRTQESPTADRPPEDEPATPEDAPRAPERLPDFEPLPEPDKDSYAAYTWSDGTVARWVNENTIPIQIEAESDPAFIERFEVDTFPSVLVIEPGGRLRARIRGFRNPGSLLEELEERIAATDPVAAAHARLRRSGGTDLSARLAYANALRDTGNNLGALREYATCLNALSMETGLQPGAQLAAVKVLAVKEMSLLAQRFAPARDELLKRYVRLKELIASGAATGEDAAIFAAIGTHLDRVDETLGVYRQLKETSPNAAVTILLRPALVDALVDIRRYQEVLDLIDVPQHFDTAYEQYQANAKRPLPSGGENEAFRTFLRRQFVESTIKYYEVLVGVGAPEAARKIAQRILSVDAGSATYAALAAAGLRSGRPGEEHLEQAKKAVELAGADLPAETLLTLARILKAINKSEEAAKALEDHLPKIKDPFQREEIRRRLAADTGT